MVKAANIMAAKTCFWSCANTMPNSIGVRPRYCELLKPEQ